MAKALKKLPGVLSFQRCLMVTDALFFNVFADGSISPLPVVRHGIRGTQNINKFSDEKKDNDSIKSAPRKEIPNIQTTDSAKLDPLAEKLRVRFDVRFLDLSSALFACAPGKADDMEDLTAFRQGLTAFIDKGKESAGVTELACRYARNLANGRFLWRNRAIAEHVSVRVRDRAELDVRFDALQVPLNTFDSYSEAEKAVAERIAAGLRGQRDVSLLVEADVDFGVRGALEVFPSQNYLEGKGKDTDTAKDTETGKGKDKSRGFARSLYCVGEVPKYQDKYSVQERGQAAFRDQKVGNALRTIDTWYPAYGERGLAIPVEPNGASLDAQLFFRNEKKISGFGYMLRAGDMDPDTPEGMFLTACIIRGGVFSESA
ncbi:type I-F CRISPR-associated protein Csy3 [Desulfovibrio sp. 86]|uniref:CRISPR-associated protein, Csy3 family n=1 Tax=uncultured Desulfovibrio sp. TaxID=167968 RepID=A0A212L021_9BACT|nr:type I-F CRISPR-associated protein Csy3 [Desulfovibrio sp. 86]SCM70924.1 CRISPR-associated protein, Csy3 family [uncultured Desulfovibrio sp.]VZH32595.1 CRISPR-associated protein, Csy3 family [Desulfovibrio sp. 86]